MEISQHILLAVIAVPFIGFLFALISHAGQKSSIHNAIYVTVFTVISNIALLWRIFTQLNIQQRGLQFITKYNWIEIPRINLVFGVDIF